MKKIEYSEGHIISLLEGNGRVFKEFRRVHDSAGVAWVCHHGTDCQTMTRTLVQTPNVAGGCKLCMAENVKKGSDNKETRYAQSEARKKYFSDPEKRRAMSIHKKEVWSDPSVRDAASARSTEFFKNNPDATKRHSEFMKARWKSMSKEEYELFVNSRKGAWASMSEEEKKIISDKHRELWDLTSQEYKNSHAQFSSEKSKAWWASLSEEERKDFSLRWSKSKKVWWVSLSEEEKKAISDKFSLTWSLKTKAEINERSVRRRDSLFENKDALHSMSLLYESKDAVQQQIKAFIISLGFAPTFSHAKSALGVLECDITIPEKNLGFEVNGVIWHSDSVGRKSYNEKSQCCAVFKEQGTRVYHIEHFEWQSQRQICESYIKSLLGVSDHRVFARNCTVGYPTKEEQRAFYARNHFLGYTPARLCLGLLYKGEWVSMLSIGQSNRSKHSNTVNRFATSLNTNCVGGFSKLMSNVPTDLKQDLYTFIDLSKFDGNSYASTGWEFVERLPVDYRVFYKDNIYNKSLWQKSLIRERFPERDFGDMTEFQMEDAVGAFRVWDVGKLKLRYKG